MAISQRWILPRKLQGQHLKRTTWKWDPALIAALLELASQETQEQGVKISAPTFATNLMLGKGPYWNQKRAELKRHIKTLQQENHHVKRTTQDAQHQAE